MLSQKGEWTALILPAIAECDAWIPTGPNDGYLRKTGDPLHPKAFSVEAMARKKAEVGSYIYSAQYNQSPSPAEGNLIKRVWFQRYSVQPPLPWFERVCQSWDFAQTLAASGDNSVCTTWGVRKNEYYLLDVYKGKFELPDLVRSVSDRAKLWGANAVLAEADGTGRGVLQTLRSHMPEALIPIRPRGDKEARLVKVSAIMEARRVYLPENAPYLADYEEEMFSFPGEHDDQVDSTTQFLNWIVNSGPPQLQTRVTIIPMGGESSFRNRYADRMSGW